MDNYLGPINDKHLSCHVTLWNNDFGGKAKTNINIKESSILIKALVELYKMSWPF